jgi:nicotinate-nucleotide pyrophosphorylase (carboxylating)
MRTRGDIRDRIFLPVTGRRYVAQITAQAKGVLSGMEWLEKGCGRLGLKMRAYKESGQGVQPQEAVAVVEGKAKQMALAEEELLGWISKSSGIATAARRAKMAAGKDLKVVSGAWKKMPLPIKDLVRQAILDGGIHLRISGKPFLYLDKNYLKILGGVENALLSIRGWKDVAKVVQLKSEGKTLLEEALVAVNLGAHVIMIDTGRRQDIRGVDRLLKKKGIRKKVKIAFGGKIQIQDLKVLRKMPVNIVDIGKAIVDAPLLDMKLDVLRRI